ncbi:MAG TPA: TRAP transporter small permease [Hyphomicrobiaceae bacterium]|jgi:TRAP-type C4-dicarboxylate transport system permease small subunit
MRAFLRRLDDAAARGEEIFLAAALGLLTVLVVAAVVFRYALHDPLTWSEEFIVLLFGWAIMIGTAYAFHQRNHIVIDVILLFAPRWLRIVLGTLSTIATFVVLAVLVWFGWQYTMREFPNLTPMLGISAAWSILPLTIGCALSMLHVLRRLLDDGPQSALWVEMISRKTDE